MPDIPIRPIAFTCGDPAGVGPEIIKTWAQQHPTEAQHICAIGPSSWLDQVRDDVGDAIAVGSSSFDITPGQPSLQGATVAYEALEQAAAGCKNGRFAATVTAPVSKVWLQHAGFPFPGQTEFFATRWGGRPVMAFAGGSLRVVLTTWHVPLTEVRSYLNQETLTRTVAQADRLTRILSPQSLPPRIGVCGFNPHAGESGCLGSEEREHLNPILLELRSHYPGLSLCEPADTLFWRHRQGDFDVVVALYHDQGLAPLKTLEFRKAVNITLGLPWIRTSPDHGTALAIAGKGIAHTESFSNAVTLARILQSIPSERGVI